MGKWILRYDWPSAEARGIKEFWIFRLLNACDVFLESSGENQRRILRLIGFGARRCRSFLGDSKVGEAIFHALCSVDVFIPALKYAEDRIRATSSKCVHV
jgi:hypothetical protein